MKAINLILIPGALIFFSSALAQPAALPDQHGEMVSLSSYQSQYPDQAILAIVVNGRKLRLVKGWEEGLRASYPQLVSMRVADIKDEPRPSQEQVAEKLRKRAPEGVSILIDLENRWATEYSLDTNEPCLLLFAGDGTLVAQFRGRASKAHLGEVNAALAEWLQSPVSEEAAGAAQPANRQENPS